MTIQRNSFFKNSCVWEPYLFLAQCNTYIFATYLEIKSKLTLFSKMLVLLQLLLNILSFFYRKPASSAGILSLVLKLVTSPYIQIVLNSLQCILIYHFLYYEYVRSYLSLLLCYSENGKSMILIYFPVVKLGSTITNHTENNIRFPHTLQQI